MQCHAVTICDAPAVCWPRGRAPFVCHAQFRVCGLVLMRVWSCEFVVVWGWVLLLYPYLTWAISWFLSGARACSPRGAGCGSARAAVLAWTAVSWLAPCARVTCVGALGACWLCHGHANPCDSPWPPAMGPPFPARMVVTNVPTRRHLRGEDGHPCGLRGLRLQFDGGGSIPTSGRPLRHSHRDGVMGPIRGWAPAACPRVSDISGSNCSLVPLPVGQRM